MILDQASSKRFYYSDAHFSNCNMKSTKLKCSSKVLLGKMSFSSSPSKGSRKSSMKRQNKKPVKRTWPFGGPSAGYIGKTNLKLIPQYFNDLSDKLSLDLQETLDLTIKLHDDLIEHHGVVEGTSKWKRITLYANGLLEGRNPENPGWVSTGRKDRWPNSLGHLRPVWHFILDHVKGKAIQTDGDIATARRFLSTLFKINRVCLGTNHADISQIIKKHKMDPALLAGFEQFVRTELAEIREKISLTDFSFKLFLGPNDGPNGLPKADSALVEAAVLNEDEELMPHFQGLCELTANNGFLSFMTQCAKKVSSASDTKGKILRKITCVKDKGNKGRIVAICDFWTQSALASIEANIIKVTMQLFPENCAFLSHSEGWSKILAQPLEVQQRLVSLDASNWTDHFPGIFQQIMLKVLYGQDFAHHWYKLVVTCPWSVPGFKHPIRYGKGQGMGTKGSFAIAQLTDLLFIKWTLQKAYGEDNINYFIKVGDDLVIEDTKNAMRSAYSDIGVDINDAKSKYFTKFGSFIEFVSRNSWNGIDISILSPKLISRFMRDSHYAVTFFNHVKERDPTIKSINQVFKIKESVLARNPNFDSERYWAHARSIIKCITLMDWSSGSNSFESEWYDWKGYTESDIINIVRNLTLVTFANLVHNTILLYQDKPSLISKEKVNILLSRLSFKDSWDKFFDWVSQQKLSLEDVILIQNAKHFIELQNSKYDKGVNTPLPEFQVFDYSKKDHPNNIYLNRRYIDFLINMQIQIDEMSLAYKVYRRYSLFDQANTKTVVHLHRFLNDVLNRTEIPLDLETGQYRLPYVSENKPEQERYVKLPLDIIQQFLDHFGFGDYISQIEKYHQDKEMDKVLIPFNYSTQGAEETEESSNIGNVVRNSDGNTKSPR